MKRKLIIILILIVALIGGGGIAYYYNYENSNYVNTDDAQVTADMVTVTPMLPGQITAWNVKEGDIVTKGQILGQQDTSPEVTSSAISSPALSAAGGTIASNAEIKAPISGKVIQSTAVDGQMAAAGTSLAVIADTSNIYITANIKETNISELKLGQKVDISIDAYKGKTFTGYIENIGQAANSIFSLLPAQNASGNYTKVTQLIPVKISIINDSNMDLMPGMNATVNIHIK